MRVSCVDFDLSVWSFFSFLFFNEVCIGAGGSVVCVCGGVAMVIWECERRNVGHLEIMFWW